VPEQSNPSVPDAAKTKTAFFLNKKRRTQMANPTRKKGARKIVVFFAPQAIKKHATENPSLVSRSVESVAESL
jgi:hypothetical protein